MSKDKHKKRDRAYAFIRGLRTRMPRQPVGVNPYGFWGKGVAKATISGPLPAVVRYCINRGLASLRRTAPGTIRFGRSRHNLFDADN
jgi:hypothetical protein